ncbi:hypothetical protein EVAR_20582_1 [Eumeta japonica]|uniref:Uncharacterized protein n=1 Tax=Eumeta variegata TaxID=151549 RepID=A0A4C1USB9_EUMVA|nr:hypothetical protein EVAR_20582_1 [Eumeta japonica]
MCVRSTAWRSERGARFECESVRCSHLTYACEQNAHAYCICCRGIKLSGCTPVYAHIGCPPVGGRVLASGAALPARAYKRHFLRTVTTPWEIVNGFGSLRGVDRLLTGFLLETGLSLSSYGTRFKL